ncbi:Protein kinase-like domain [Pseudocohnilembus persalinus]|uniref:non-specific serine/threonine protein kinase n=1 Tax=Pseudocohnilembus persalinus TaxID=266149 RepID=A0A0V0QDC4_PSEPJ|nr:Protein kinase-like domain [Pseudocohnilembus persalinus]|eukprot:KRX00212.1 Protein kinase-like domain [Pseudocohnilembus persalinus]
MQTRSRGQTPKKSMKTPQINKDSNKKSAQKKASKQNQNQNQPPIKSEISINKSDFVQNVDIYKSYKRLRKKDIIGQGAFGKIFKIRPKDANQNEKALKIIKKQKLNPQEVLNFKNEVNVLKELDHPNIIKINQFYEDSQNYYLIMEYIQGKDLLDEIQETETFNEIVVAQIMEQIFGALNYSHQNNLVHRDIKPENIMVEKDNQNILQSQQENKYNIKIIDWGTGIKFDQNDSKFITQKCGSVDYAAPEVFQGKYTEKCDIWSAGVIMYILLGGYHPFGQSTSFQSNLDFGNHLSNTNFDFNDTEWDQISGESKDLIKKLLQKNPAKRLSAEQALQHPWFEKMKTQVQLNTQEQFKLNKSLKRLQQMKAQNTLHDAVITYIASQLISKNETEELKKAFQILDTNKDGQLSKDEILHGYRNIFGEEYTQDEICDIFDQIDIDKNGTISYTEFIASFMNIENQFTDQKLAQTFRLFDKDGDGQIESKELMNVIGGKMIQKEKDQIFQEIIREIDDDMLMSLNNL